MDKKAYTPSKAVEEYIENFAYSPGMENLSYDEIKPNDDWMEMNIEGSAKTGNGPGANAIDTGLGKKINASFTSTVVANTRTFVFNQTLKAGETVTLKIFTTDEPNLGYYEIPNSLEKNPLNENLEQFTLGQANDHLKTMIEVDTGFQGEFPGASNIRDIVNYRQNGSRFMKRS